MRKFCYGGKLKKQNSVYLLITDSINLELLFLNPIIKYLIIIKLNWNSITN